MKKSFGERVFLVVNNLLLVMLCVLCLVPLLYIVSSSVSSGAAIDAGKVFLWPVGFTTAAYQVLLNTSNLFRYFSNSILVTLVGTMLSLGATVLCAYPLSKKYLIGRNKIAFFCIFTMLFSAAAAAADAAVSNARVRHTSAARGEIMESVSTSVWLL